MAATKTIAATVRIGTGKGAARSVRREGRIPGVIYGGGEAAAPISLDHREVNKLIYAGHFLTTIFEINVDGTPERVIPRDYQLDVVRDIPLHVDFLRLKAGAKLRIEVPVHFINHDAAPGIKRGGSLNIVRHTVEMMVPADAMPEALVADLTGLDINDSVHISAITLPENCRPTITDRDFTIASIAAPITFAEEVPAAGAAPAAAGKGAPAKGGAAAKPAAAAAAKPAAAKPAAAKPAAAPKKK